METATQSLAPSLSSEHSRFKLTRKYPTAALSSAVFAVNARRANDLRLRTPLLTLTITSTLHWLTYGDHVLQDRALAYRGHAADLFSMLWTTFAVYLHACKSHNSRPALERVYTLLTLASITFWTALLCSTRVAAWFKSTFIVRFFEGIFVASIGVGAPIVHYLEHSLGVLLPPVLLAALCKFAHLAAPSTVGTTDRDMRLQLLDVGTGLFHLLAGWVVHLVDHEAQKQGNADKVVHLNDRDCK